MRCHLLVKAALLGILAPVYGASWAQQIGSFNSPAKQKGYVTFAGEPQTAAAGKRSLLELHFRVLDGFHVNSHTPKSELLIPTQLVLQPVDGVNVGGLEYPPGIPYSFISDPKEKLEVYSGPFTVKLPVVASAGDHTIEATLKYQACDHAACYPPKSLPVQILFTAR